MVKKSKESLVNNLKDMKVYKDIAFLDLFKRAFFTIKPSKKRILFFICVFFIMLYPSYFIIVSGETLQTINLVLDKANTIILSLFAVGFTGYALFQALINRNTLKILFVSKGKKYSLFEEYNLYFFSMTIAYLCIIIFNFIMIIFTIAIKPEWFSIEMKRVLNPICIAFISLYLSVIVSAVVEIKSFILNLFQCFNISATSQMIEELKNLDDDLQEKK
ncbi:hypothetical protein ACSW9K_07025 [Clostridium perfringens]|uniref:hypothetical protein n=1 Tax=Clostridium perfringens TaxID=1502 RepID=UPI002910F40B|nr:hypothetical protein [Clostridium perfringens]MDM0932846.1 hypothetical protein [Clostridium perfringens]MDM0956557.1 hypothetical protein [Clostridium perfringens]MDU4220059.1 hypothetical protein [Clostridium perfringens]MDU5038943.1 hypothetical protein [Clostridium perfringens]MDU5489045.1 hypothetical protein [Clostridium perfringens]